MDTGHKKQGLSHCIRRRRYLWVIDPKKGMGYWVLESMGYAHKIPANQLGGQ